MSDWTMLDVGETGARRYLAGRDDGAIGVVLYHAWWGLTQDIISFADRLAAAGFMVAAPDLVDGAVATTIEEADALAEGASEEHGDRVALAAIDDLAARLGPGAKLGSIGFSFGAAWSVWCASERPQIGASVVYYGAVTGPSLQRASGPVLGHFAESDPFESEENVAAFQAAVRDAGREVTLHRYPNTGHWFAEPSQDAYRADAADLAFERTVAFLRRHLARSP